MAITSGHRIVDRSPAFGRTFTYSLTPARGQKRSKKWMAEALSVHEAICGVMTPRQKRDAEPDVFRPRVLALMSMPAAERASRIAELGLDGFGTSEPSSGSRMADIIDQWLSWKASSLGVTEKAQRQLRGWAECLKSFCREMGIIHVTQLRRSHADDYVDWRNARAGRILSAHSLNMEINAMKAALQRAKDLDTASVPDERVWRTAEVKAVPGVNRKVVMPLDMGQQMRLLEVLQTRHPWARDITLFLLLTGMRISELDGMSRGDVHLAEMVIDLHGRSVGGGSASGKTEHAPRILPIVPALVPLLQGESLWIRSSQPVGDRLRTVLKRMRDEIGFPVSPHQLRHSYATNHLQSEPRDLPVVSYRLGHSSIQVTKDIYAKWLRSEMAVGIELFTRAYKEHLARLEGRHAVNQISGVG